MATPREDIKLNNNDISISTGDFLIVFSDEQHVIDTINAFPGWWKQNPLDGVGVPLFLGGPSSDNILIREIKIQLDSDGYDTTQSKIIRDSKNETTIYPNATLR